MKALMIIGAFCLMGTMATGIWYLVNNLTLKKGRRK